MCLTWAAFDESRGSLALTEGWSRRWRATWRRSGASVIWPVRDLASVPAAEYRPGGAIERLHTGMGRPGWRSTVRAGLLDLTPGSVVVLDGEQWLVAGFEPQYGHVTLRRDEETVLTTVRALLRGHV